MSYIILILLLTIILYFVNKNILYVENYNKIPNMLFKTGPYDIPTNDLENIFNYNKKRLKVNKIFYYNDKECQDFMNNMGSKVIKAYNSLIPTAYKADLWRYCILYKYGGIYGDMTQKFYRNYDVNKSDVDMVLVRDINDEAIQISFMATKPYNPFFKYIIISITNDILNKKKGRNCLDISGPYAFCRYFKSYYNIKKIPEGIFILKGKDGKNYKIRIDLRQTKGFVFREIKTRKIFASTKTIKHNKDLEVVTKLPKYNILYDTNKVYKN